MVLPDWLTTTLLPALKAKVSFVLIVSGLADGVAFTPVPSVPTLAIHPESATAFLT